jgi:protoporphyrinogen/coproporphyrinogen III oxidase
MTPDDRDPWTQPRVAVVGGGIAGLTAAREVLVRVPDAQVTVYETARDVGGKLRVGEIAGVPVDEGAEAMLYRRPEAADLARAVGLADRLVHPVVTTAAIWTYGALRPLPPGLLGIPGDVGQAVRAGLLTRAAGMRARFEHGMRPAALDEDIGVGSLVARRLGAPVRDRIVEPLFGGVYAGHADALSTFAAAPQIVSGLREHGSLLAAAADAVRRGSTNQTPLFAGLVGGVGTLVSAVAADIERRGGQLRCGVVVRELRPTAESADPPRTHGWELVVGAADRPEAVVVDAVVLACPAAPAARLLRDAVPNAAVELARVEYASMAVVLLAFDRGEVGGELTGSGFLVPPVDGRTVKAATFSSHKWRWMADGPVVVRCSIGRHGEERMLQRDDRELAEVAVGDLRAATGLASRLVGSRVVRWGGALPQYAVGHLDRVARVRRAVGAAAGLAVCGAAFDGLGIPACIASAQHAANQVIAAIGR